MTDTTVPVTRGRRRSAAADQAILGATLDLLQVDGYAGLTMAAVIELSGTSSATVYRRWETKQDLVAAAIGSLAPTVVAVDTGSFDEDVAAFIVNIAETLCPNPDDLGQEVVAELGRNPEFRTAVTEKFVQPRVDALGAILRHARRRGEIGPRLTAKEAYGLVSGPLYYRVHIQEVALTPSFIRTVTVAAKAALRAAAESSHPD